MNTFNITDFKSGDKFKIVNNIDNNVEKIKNVKIEDIGVLEGILNDKLCLSEINGKWKYVYFIPHQVEKLTGEECKESLPQFTITKSRWDEIIENTSKPLNIMTDEEVEVVRSVLKDNTPFCVVDDPIDHVISKETHLDATHVGCTGNFALYYKSETLKKWFYWNNCFRLGS